MLKGYYFSKQNVSAQSVDAHVSTKQNRLKLSFL